MNCKVIGFVVAMFATMALATSVPAAPPRWPGKVDALVANARKGLPTVGMAAFLKAVQDPKGAMILDVREPAEFADGHVPGAVNVPRGVLEFQIWKAFGYPGKIDYGRTIYVQCATGGRASLAAQTLETLGFRHPIVVLMNFADWAKAGNPVVK